MNHNGTSIVDYLLAHRKNSDLLDTFAIGDFSPFSNHSPLFLLLKVNTVFRSITGNGKSKFYKIDNTYRKSFASDITNNVDTLINDLKLNSNVGSY